ncbi:hypothetical protein FQZ97_1059570 [compost metagenome]
MITRRSFLKLLGLAAAAGAVIPALDLGRAPYVNAGELVSWIGHCPHPDAFIGGKSVHAVLPWDGAGYPVLVWNNAFGAPRALERYYDVDLADFNREIPRGFWHNPANRRFPNVHTWLRIQRYGESIEAAAHHLNFVGISV